MEDPRNSEFSCQVDDDQAVLSAPGVSLRFTRPGDRWSHRLESPRVKGEGGYVVSQDISVHEDQRRILSPVYQEVQRHELAEESGLCLLLTGRFFQHHFSAAITLREYPGQPGFLELDFDVADRCRTPIESLAATYIVGLDSGALVEASPERIAWNAVHLGWERIELMAEPPASLALAKAGRVVTCVQVLAPILPGTFTHRLRYRWRWVISTDRTR